MIVCIAVIGRQVKYEVEPQVYVVSYPESSKLVLFQHRVSFVTQSKYIAVDLDRQLVGALSAGMVGACGDRHGAFE